MCLMKYGLNLPFWEKFSEKFLENRLQWICSFETLELGVGVKQIFQVPVGAYINEVQRRWLINW